MKKKTNSKNDTKPIINRRTEKDIDELVHLKKEETPVQKGEEDPDDLVHSPYQPKTASGDIEDPDDLVHDDSENDE